MPDTFTNQNLTYGDFHATLTLFDSASRTLNFIGWLRDRNPPGEIPAGYERRPENGFIVNDAFVESCLKARRRDAGLQDGEEPEGWLREAEGRYLSALNAQEHKPVSSLEEPMRDLAKPVVPMLLRLVSGNEVELQRLSGRPIHDWERDVKRIERQVERAPRNAKADDPARKAIEAARSTVTRVVSYLKQIGAVPVQFEKASDPFLMDITTFCHRLYHCAQEEARRLQQDPDDVYEGWDDKPRPFDAVTDWLSIRTGLKYEDVMEYVLRAGRGCQWGGARRRKGGSWPDISHIATRMSNYCSADRMAELLARFCAEYPVEAREMGLPEPVDRGGATITNTLTRRGSSFRGTSRHDLRKKAEQYIKRQGDRFPGVNALAKILECAPSSLSNAICESSYLKARRAEHKAERRRSSRTISMNEVKLDSIPQQTERDPGEVALENLIAEQKEEIQSDERQANRHQRSSRRS